MGHLVAHVLILPSVVWFSHADALLSRIFVLKPTEECAEKGSHTAFVLHMVEMSRELLHMSVALS